MFISKNIFKTTLLSIITLTLGINQSAHALLSLPNAPLFLGNNIQPNIMFSVDDSGSMDWEVLKTNATVAIYPNTGGFANSGNVDITPTDTDTDELLESCAGYNVMYYNPNLTFDNYTPWIGEDSAGNTFTNQPITAARIEPYNIASGTIDLTAIDGGGDPSGYIPWTDNGDGIFQAGECADNSGVPSVNYAQFMPVSGMSPAQQTNFANWYSYYRKREYVLKRVMSELIDSSTDRLGIASLHNHNNIGTPVTDMTVTANKETLEDMMFSINSNNGTPLRRLLNNVGQYFDDTDGSGAPSAIGFTDASPILPANLGGECQQNFAVLMSDGFWNGSNPGVANEDGGATTTHNVIFPDNTTKTVQVNGGPHTDTFSETLADVAMKFYKNDLSALTDRVPAILITDESNQQRMITYAVSFGLTGTLPKFDPANPIPADHEPLTPAPPPTGWPQPMSGTATTLDDMRHAAFNGRGVFLNASDPQELITSLANAIGDIENRTAASGSSVAIGTSVLSTGSRIYSAGFNPSDYSGTLEAFPIDPLTGNIGATLWNANSLNAGNRGNIFTIVSKSGTDTPIDFVTTDNDLKTAVTPPIVPPAVTAMPPGVDVINYVRGDVPTLEIQNGGIYRNRNTLLGDIVSSTPFVLTEANFGYNILPGSEGSTYPAYFASQASAYAGTPTDALIIVGTNAGMVHAFRANTSGSETFAYVPKTVHSNLHLLTDPNYIHKFFINSPGNAGDAYLGGNWEKTLCQWIG